MNNALTKLLRVLLLFPALGVGAAQQNSVVTENQHEGTTGWMLTQIQPVEGESLDEKVKRRPAIEGFCSHTSIEPGRTLKIYVSARPASTFNLDIYRMGYYGGKGGRIMKQLGPFQGVPQPVPEEGPKQLMECQWEASVELTVPEDWLSGVYLGKLTEQNHGYQAYVVFIVKDRRKADLVFQCSDLTWQAYNRWPEWRSLYDWKENRWHVEPGADVSFDRPYSVYYNGLPMGFNPLTNGSGEFLLWEFPLAFWLEKEGFDVTYISNLDTHQGIDLLVRGEVFLSVGHDEYWTRQMFEHVRKAREQGVDLAFLCGNSVYTEIDLGPSNAGGTNRVFGRIQYFEDERELMGASSYGVGLGPWICIRPDHWLYEGTGMDNGDTIKDLVGWEFHGPPLKESEQLVVLAEGELKNSNGHTHAATMEMHDNGGMVFNAGTCWWSMVLSSPPGFKNPPNKDFSEDDPRVQRMTRNLLERMLKD